MECEWVQRFWRSNIKVFSSVAQSCPTLCDPMNRSMPGLPVHHQLLEFTQTHVHWVGDAIQLVMPSSHLILCCPLLLLPPIPPSIRVLSNESTLHMRWPKYSYTHTHKSQEKTRCESQISFYFLPSPQDLLSIPRLGALPRPNLISNSHPSTWLSLWDCILMRHQPSHSIWFCQSLACLVSTPLSIRFSYFLWN